MRNASPRVQQPKPEIEHRRPRCHRQCDRRNRAGVDALRSVSSAITGRCYQSNIAPVSFGGRRSCFVRRSGGRLLSGVEDPSLLRLVGLVEGMRHTRRQRGLKPTDSRSDTNAKVSSAPHSRNARTGVRVDAGSGTTLTRPEADLRDRRTTLAGWNPWSR